MKLLIGPTIFAMGGVFLLFLIDLILKETSLYTNYDQAAFFVFLVIFGFLAFFLLGFGLLAIIASTVSSEEQTKNQRG